jgi:hypothetical protein
LRMTMMGVGIGSSVLMRNRCPSRLGTQCVRCKLTPAANDVRISGSGRDCAGILKTRRIRRR